MKYVFGLFFRNVHLWPLKSLECNIILQLFLMLVLKIYECATGALLPPLIALTLAFRQSKLKFTFISNVDHKSD